MKDKRTPRFLLPTTDMKKAIDRNAKKDEDLSLLLNQLDKEKKVALEQLTRRQDAFKKEIIKKHKNQGNKFNIQFFEHGNVTSTRDEPRPETNRPCRMQGLRRAFSFEETRASSIVELPPLINKGHSLPSSPIPHDYSEEISHCSVFKTVSDITTHRRANMTKNTSINFKNSHPREEMDEAATNDDQFEAFPAHKIASNPSCAKTRDCKAQNAIRRHSTAASAVATTVDADNSRILRRRRITLHNLMTSIEACVPEVETVVRLSF